MALTSSNLVRRNGTYYLRKQFKGKRYFRSLKTSNSRTALARAKKMQDAIIQGLFDVLDQTKFQGAYPLSPVPKKLASYSACLRRCEVEITDCIYFLVFRHEVVYVGQSTNFHARIQQHLSANKMEFDTVFYIPTSVDQLDETERFFIKELRPKNNKAFGSW